MLIQDYVCYAMGQNLTIRNTNITCGSYKLMTAVAYTQTAIDQITYLTVRILSPYLQTTITFDKTVAPLVPLVLNYLWECCIDLGKSSPQPEQDHIFVIDLSPN